MSQSLDGYWRFLVVVDIDVDDILHTLLQQGIEDVFHIALSHKPLLLIIVAVASIWVHSNFEGGDSHVFQFTLKLDSTNQVLDSAVIYWSAHVSKFCHI